MDSSSLFIFDMIAKSGPFASFILLFTTAFSVVSFAVIFQKWKQTQKIKQQNRDFLKQFNAVAHISDLKISPDQSSSGFLENISRIGLSEFNRLLKTVMSHPKDSVNSFFIETQFSIIKDQIEKTASEETINNDRYLVVLAITGSTCPLLGLLGTVWGITRAFADIGKMGQASLTVVAPGIAEALITTIWGIGVAIPAVIGYNAFANRAKNHEDEAYNFSALLLNKIKIYFFELLYRKDQDK